MRRKEEIACRVYAVFLILFLSVSAIPTFPSTANVSSDYHRQISVRIEPEQMEIIKIEDFDWIALPECSHISTQGHPALPIKSVVVRLPRNTELVEINIIRMASIGVPGKHRVAPALKPRVISDNTETKIVDDGMKSEVLSENSLFSEPLLEIYNSSISYPSKLFDYYSSKGREYNYVMIYFYPVKLAPLEGGLTLVSEATFDVEYTIEAEGPQSFDDPSLDEVIITAPAYETEANVLAGWRNATQVRTAVFTTGWIYSNYGGVDEPEKIRNFIGDMFNDTGIRYVLLFGDVNDVPTRFAYVPDGDDVGGPDGIEVPTDYYYECLEGTWNPNGDGKYADLEKDDYAQIDFIPEVSVGRLSVDEATAGYVVDKIIEYEKNIDPAWSKKMVLAGTDPFKDYAGAEGEILKDYIEGILQGNFTEFTKLYETLGTLSSSAISDNINLGSSGVNFAGHGNYGLWSLEGAGSYTNSDAAGLTNGNRLPIVATMACLTAGFDSMYNTGNCIGEEFLRNPNGGSAAYVGATRTAWGYEGTGITSGLAGELDWRFWESYKLGVTQPGPMLSEAKIGYIASHPLNTTYRVSGKDYYLDEKTVLEYVLLGDPVLFAEKPSTLVKTYKDSAYSKESKFFTINDTVYVEADVRGYGGANISSADVHAEFYVDSGLEANIALAHLGGDSSLYRGSWVSNSSSSIGVYLVNVTVSSPYESAPGGSGFHLYSGSGVSAYRLDWNDDGNDDYVLENEHLVSVFDGGQYTDQSIVYLYQKDIEIAYTFRRISDPDSIGRGEVTASGMSGIQFYSFSLSQEGENLANADLKLKTNLTKWEVATKKFTYYDSSNGASYDANYIVDRSEWIAQQFNADDIDRNYILEKVSVYVVSVVGGSYPLSVEIRSDSNNLPSNVVLTSETIPKASVPITLGWYDVVFSNSITLAPGGKYWLVLKSYEPHQGPFNFGYAWTGDNSAPTYPGALAYSTNQGSSWTDGSAYYDMIFRAYGYFPGITTSFNMSIQMRSEDVDYLVYRLHNFDGNISDFSNIFSDVAGTLGSSVGDDRYHLEDGTDGFITSLTADQWNDCVISDYVCVYDNSTSADPADYVVMAWVRFNETQTVAYQDVGLWNDAGFAAEGLRIRHNASQALATDEVSYILAFTKGNWKTIDQWMPTIESGQYPDRFMKILGDVNGDGIVNASDLLDLSKAYGSKPGDLNWNPNCDFNGDNKVDVSDLFDLSKNYGKPS